MARIRHIVFHSTDVERLAKFYVDVMGLKIVHRVKNGGISLTDGYINLSIHTNKIDGQPRRRRARPCPLEPWRRRKRLQPCGEGTVRHGRQEGRVGAANGGNCVLTWATGA